MRISEHPIIEDFKKGREVEFFYNGEPMIGLEGEPIAMALKNNGILVTRYTIKNHEPRGMFCAIGRCTDCVMVVNGIPNTRTCITPLEEGMRVETQDGKGRPFRVDE